MNLLQVTGKKSAKEFLKVPKILYKNDPYWVCPLDNETESIFDPKKNHLLTNGNASRWILKNEQDKLIGRIAAFYNRVSANKNKQPTGGIGWFECINDQGAANLLFDTAKAWLAKEGMEAMDGPINFGENDSNCGLLIKGFSHPGYGMPYNFPYYKELFENYGFKLYFEQYSYHLDATVEFPERFWKIAEWVLRKADLKFSHFRFKESDKFIRDMVQIYNAAWSEFKENFTPLDPEILWKSLKRAKYIMDEELIWFAYHHDEPVGFFIILPDINQILKHFNGKLHVINLIRFFYYKFTHKITRLRAIVAGVVPKYQNTGIESGVIKQLESVFKKKYWYTEIELSWVGDFNPKMRSFYEAMGAKLAKTHITYRYLFDPTAKFERFMHEVIDKLEKKKFKAFQKEIYVDTETKKKKYNYLKDQA